MTTTTRLLMPLALLAVTAGVVLVTQGGDEVPLPAMPPSAGNSDEGTGGTDVPVPPLSADPGTNRREQVEPLERRTIRRDPSGSGQPQGVRGIVLGPDGRPQGDLQVFLLESAQNNPFARLQALQHGVQFPPAAQGRTSQDGSFALGIREGADKRYELRVLSEVHADHTVPDITVQSGDWIDVGRITLQRGAVLRGRVTIEGTKLPVPGARVTVRSANSFEDIASHGLPGREQGLSAEVDANGYYHIPNAPVGRANAPAFGTLVVSAEAPGFAKVTHSSVVIGPDGFEEIHFELPRGLSIQGIVTDARGAGIPDGKVIASAVSTGNPQPEPVFTDRSGSFRIPSLRDGLYHVTASAPDHQSHTEQGVAAGTQHLRLILESKGIARLRVLGENGDPLDRYTLNVREWFPENAGRIGKVHDVPQQSIRAGDLEDHVATVRGLDDGLYVFQVEADAYAKTISEPFEVATGGDAPLVELHMTRGAILTGTVTDARGAPVADATVRTQADGLPEDNPFYRMVASMVPDKVTVTRTTTDVSGRFRLQNLALGNYQLKVEHDSYCEGLVPGIELREADPVELPPIRLDRGTLVHGTASLNGLPSGQIRVVVATPPDAGQQEPSFGGGRVFRAEAVSDNSGRFELSKRVPPGTYEIKAAQQTEGGVFQMAMQYKQTARTFAVRQGQDRYEHNINIVVDR